MHLLPLCCSALSRVQGCVRLQAAGSLPSVSPCCLALDRVKSCVRMQAADNLLIAKEAIANVAAKHGMVVSFLPKPFAGGIGSGCHCHMSLSKVRTCLCRAALCVPYERSIQGSHFSSQNLLEFMACAYLGQELAGWWMQAHSWLPAACGSDFAQTSLQQDGHNLMMDLKLDMAEHTPAEAFMAGLWTWLQPLLLYTLPSPGSSQRVKGGAWSGAYRCVFDLRISRAWCCSPCCCTACPAQAAASA